MKTIKTIFFFSLLLCAMNSCNNDDDGKEITLTVSNWEESIDENPEINDVIGTIKAVLEGSDEKITYSITSQMPEGAISINSSNGTFSVADNSKFDFEKWEKVTATVKVISEGVEKTSTITINILDVDENDMVKDEETKDEETEEPTRIIWSGSKVTFSKADGADPSLDENQDKITSKVWLTRANDGGQIYNSVSESNANKSSSPAGTKWAEGSINDIDNLTFSTLRGTFSKPKNIVGKQVVLWLTEENIYIDIVFTSWSEGKNKGGFSYERSTKN